MVQVKGVEPIHPKALDPKSSASANSATPAYYYYFWWLTGESNSGHHD